MRENTRIQNSVRNVSFGLIVTVINTLSSFITRTVLVKVLGVEVLGINGLFSEIISMLSLAELGVGMAIVFSLYKPINDNDQQKISQLMSLYKSSYNTVAIVTLTLGLVITPFVHRLISDVEYSTDFIRIVFILFVIRTSSTYLFSYKTSLLNADQKQYVVSVTTAIVKLIFTLIISISVFYTKNYIVYLIIMIVQTIVTNIALSLYVDKLYPFIDYHEKLQKDEKREIFCNIKNIFIKRVSGVITSSTDNILISKLVSTVQVGFYSNYVLLFSVIRTLKQQFTNGIAASIGNLSVTSDSNHCILVLKRLTFLYFVFGFVMSSGLMVVSSTFITIWLGVDYVMSNDIVYLAIFNLFLEICCEPLWQYLEVSGLFKKDKNIAILGSVINLIVSIVLGLKIGIVGIFIGTVCTQVIQLVLKTKLLFKDKFHKSAWNYYLFWIKMIIGYVILVILDYFVLTKMVIPNVYLSFIFKGTISIFAAGIVVVLLFVKSNEFNYSVLFFLKMIKRIPFKGKIHE